MSNTIILKDNNGDVSEYERSLLDDIKPEQYLNAEEISDHVICISDTINLRYIKKMKSDDLISLHMSLGLWIRNEFGLWNDECPWTNGGQADDKKHPDNYSFKIIEQIWDKLQKNSNLLPPATSEPFVVQ